MIKYFCTVSHFVSRYAKQFHQFYSSGSMLKYLEQKARMQAQATAEELDEELDDDPVCIHLILFVS